MTDGFPFDQDGEWLKAALHTHTTRSDGLLDPEPMVEHCEWLGFDVIAITDHWTLTKVASTEKILVITGAELAADAPAGMDNDVEILAIGIDEIPDDPGGDRRNWGLSRTSSTRRSRTSPPQPRRSRLKAASVSSPIPTGAG